MRNVTTLQFDQYEIEVVFTAHLKPALTDDGVSYEIIYHFGETVPEGLDCLECGAYVRIPRENDPINLIRHWSFHAKMWA